MKANSIEDWKDRSIASRMRKVTCIRSLLENYVHVSSLGPSDTRQNINKVEQIQQKATKTVRGRSSYPARRETQLSCSAWEKVASVEPKSSPSAHMRKSER